MFFLQYGVNLLIRKLLFFKTRNEKKIKTTLKENMIEQFKMNFLHFIFYPKMLDLKVQFFIVFNSFSFMQ